MARSASLVMAVLFSSLAAPIAGADPGQFRAPVTSGPLLGSFESAGMAVFVRAHEARRSLSETAGSKPLSYSPVVSEVALGGLGSPDRLQVDTPSTTGSAGRLWVAPSNDPKRPGELKALDPVNTAAPFAHSGLLDAHRTPDLELEVSKRATLGVFGDAKKIEGTDIRNSTVRSTRDLGAGVTLQYRFGP